MKSWRMRPVLVMLGCGLVAGLPAGYVLGGYATEAMDPFYSFDTAPRQNLEANVRPSTSAADVVAYEPTDTGMYHPADDDTVAGYAVAHDGGVPETAPAVASAPADAAPSTTAAPAGGSATGDATITLSAR